MGEVAVLQPQDLLNNHASYNRHNFLPTTMKSQSLRNLNSGPALARSTNRRKRSPPKTPPAPPKEKKTTSAPLREKNTNHKNTTTKPSTHFVAGQVKILKRGEVLPTSSLSAVQVDASPKEAKKEKKAQKVGAAPAGGLDNLLDLSSANRLGPAPDVVPKPIPISDFYAGSAFISSPEPSSLPVPFFFKKKDVVLGDDNCSNTNYDATSDLRRLLRLDLL